MITHLKHHGAGHLHHAAAGAIGPHGLPAHFPVSIAIVVAFWAGLVLIVQLLKGSGRRSAQRYY